MTAEEDLTPPSTGTVRILERGLSLLETALPPPARIADVPCGTGYLTVRATEKGYEVEPFDLAPELFEGGARFKVGEVDLNEPLHIEDGRFDGVVCCEGIEHLENPWQALREFKRILRPGGVLVLSIPNTIDVRQRFRMLRLGHFAHYAPTVADHINLMGPLVLCHSLLDAGYEIREVASAKSYGGLRYKLLSPLFRFGKRSGLPSLVRSQLSRSEILTGRTVVLSAVRSMTD